MRYTDQHLVKIKHSDYPRQLVEYLVNRFNIYTVSWVADFGCGMGGYTVEFAKICKTVGYDLEKQNIKINTRIVDLTKPMDEEGVYDVVFSKSVIEHLIDPTVYLDNAHKVLDGGGRLILFTPDWKTSYKVFYDDYTHQRPYTEVSLLERMDASVWKNVKIELFWQIAWAWRFPLLFRLLRWTRWFLPSGDVKRRMTHAALLLTAEKA